TICDDATHSLQPQGQTLLNGYWGFHTVTAVPITHAQAQGDAAISTHAETEEHLFEIVSSVFAMPVGRPWGASYLRLVPLRAIERNRRGILMQPGCREGIALQRHLYKHAF